MLRVEVRNFAHGSIGKRLSVVLDGRQIIGLNASIDADTCRLEYYRSWFRERKAGSGSMSLLMSNDHVPI